MTVVYFSPEEALRAWTQLRRMMDAEVESILDNVGEGHPLHTKMAGLIQQIAELDKHYANSMEVAKATGHQEGRTLVQATHTKLDDIYAWVAKVRVFTQRVEEALGPWEPEESYENHNLRCTARDLLRKQL